MNLSERPTRALRLQEEHELIDPPVRSRSPTNEDHTDDLEIVVMEELGIGDEFRMDREVQLPTKCIRFLGTKRKAMCARERLTWDEHSIKFYIKE